VDVLTTFIKALNMQKYHFILLRRSYQGNYNYLFAIEDIIHNLPSLRANCRGVSIG
jgi:hypothetical protein